MEGVEILSSNEVAVDFAFNWKAALITGAITFGLFVIFGIIISFGTYDCSNIAIGFTLGIIFGVLLGMLAGVAGQTPTEHEVRYKVLISDEVSMNEFVEKYEIVDQEGKIYTVRKRG